MTIEKAFDIEKPNKTEWLKMDIQTFASEGGAGSRGVEGGGGEGGAGEGETITLSKEDLAKQVEAESDRKTASALAKRQAEWDSQLEQKIKDAKSEAARLASLSEEERKGDELSKREKDLATRLEELERKELKADAVADLATKKLPASFAEFLLGEDAEKTLTNINEFKTAFDAAVEEAAKEALRQDTPPAGSGGTNKGTSTIAELRNKQEQQKNKAPDLWA